jgi:hypothetical protein
MAREEKAPCETRLALCVREQEHHSEEEDACEREVRDCGTAAAARWWRLVKKMMPQWSLVRGKKTTLKKNQSALFGGTHVQL